MAKNDRLTVLETQVEKISRPIKAFKVTPSEGINNSIKTFEQIPVLKQRRQEEFAKSVSSLESIVSPVRSILQQFNLEQYDSYNSGYFKELYALKSSLRTPKENSLSKVLRSSSSSIRTSNSQQEEKHSSSQTTNESQNTSALLNETPKLRKNAKLLKQILLEIHNQVTCNNNQPVKWTPSAWFGKEVITCSDRVSWSNSIEKLVRQGWVKQIKPSGQASKNSGNGLSYVSPTPKGFEEAIRLLQLIQND